MSKTEKATREYLESLSKDQVINLCLQFMFDVEVTEQQLEEKQKTIDEINKEFVQTVHDWKALCAEKDKEIEMLNTTKNNAIECADLFKVALSVRQKQLAIQELEKVKNFVDGRTYCADYINKRIQDLKGE